MNEQTQWQILGCLVEIKSPWLNLIGEKVKDSQGKLLDYWRVEKADSIVILAKQEEYFLLPKPTYRPGLQKATLDFPGGRLPPNTTPAAVVPVILERELGIPPALIDEITPLNSVGWAINSSFSNQRLHGFLAEISPQAVIDSNKLGSKYSLSTTGIVKLLQDLTCLQCRAIVTEWLLHSMS